MSDTAEIVLQAESRAVRGKKVKQLRRDGFVPANVYGRNQESRAVQAPHSEIVRVFGVVDRNAVVPMAIDGASDTVPVVLREIQRHPVTRELLHLDFYQVDLSRAIHSEARLVLIGDAEAESKGGTVVQSLELVMLEALPNDMPSQIEVDITGLEDFGQSVLIRDLVLPDGVTALTDGAVAVATALAPRVTEDEEAEDELDIEGLEVPEAEADEAQAEAE